MSVIAENTIRMVLSPSSYSGGEGHVTVSGAAALATVTATASAEISTGTGGASIIILRRWEGGNPGLEVWAYDGTRMAFADYIIPDKIIGEKYVQYEPIAGEICAELGPVDGSIPGSITAANIRALDERTTEGMPTLTHALVEALAAPGTLKSRVQRQKVHTTMLPQFHSRPIKMRSDYGSPFDFWYAPSTMHADAGWSALAAVAPTIYDSDVDTTKRLLMPTQPGACRVSGDVVLNWDAGADEQLTATVTVYRRRSTFRVSTPGSLTTSALTSTTQARFVRTGVAAGTFAFGFLYRDSGFGVVERITVTVVCDGIHLISLNTTGVTSFLEVTHDEACFTSEGVNIGILMLNNLVANQPVTLTSSFHALAVAGGNLQRDIGKPSPDIQELHADELVTQYLSMVTAWGIGWSWSEDEKDARMQEIESHFVQHDHIKLAAADWGKWAKIAGKIGKGAADAGEVFGIPALQMAGEGVSAVAQLASSDARVRRLSSADARVRHSFRSSSSGNMVLRACTVQTLETQVVHLAPEQSEPADLHVDRIAWLAHQNRSLFNYAAPRYGKTRAPAVSDQAAGYIVITTTPHPLPTTELAAAGMRPYDTYNIGTVRVSISESGLGDDTAWPSLLEQVTRVLALLPSNFPDFFLHVVHPADVVGGSMGLAIYYSICGVVSALAITGGFEDGGNYLEILEGEAKLSLTKHLLCVRNTFPDYEQLPKMGANWIILSDAMIDLAPPSLLPVVSEYEGLTHFMFETINNPPLEPGEKLEARSRKRRAKAIPVLASSARARLA